MAGPKLLPEIGTGLGNRRKAPAGLGFRDEPTPPPTTKKTTPPKVVTKEKPKPRKRAARAVKPRVNDALKLREEVMAAAASGQVDQDQIMEVIQNSGIEDPEAIEAILGLRLSEKAVRYFLKNTKNNPKKAMKLAGKFGY